MHAGSPSASAWGCGAARSRLAAARRCARGTWRRATRTRPHPAAAGAVTSKDVCVCVCVHGCLGDLACNTTERGARLFALFLPALNASRCKLLSVCRQVPSDQGGLHAGARCAAACACWPRCSRKRRVQPAAVMPKPRVDLARNRSCRVSTWRACHALTLRLGQAKPYVYCVCPVQGAEDGAAGHGQGRAAPPQRSRRPRERHWRVICWRRGQGRAGAGGRGSRRGVADTGVVAGADPWAAAKHFRGQWELHPRRAVSWSAVAELWRKPSTHAGHACGESATNTIC